MAIRFALGFAALALTAATAQAQTPASPSAPSEGAAGSDTSRTVNADRDQQFALDHIRDEVRSSTRRPSKREANRVVAATAADLKPGAMVLDMTGADLGTIEAVKPEGVQLLSGGARAMVPADVFGVKGGRLMLNVSKADFEKQTGATK